MCEPTTIALVGLAISAVATAASTAVSVEAQKSQAAAQKKQAEQELDFQLRQAATEGEQQRQAAATQKEVKTIEGAKAVGQIQALGLPVTSAERLAREARATTLRDLSNIDKSFEFGQQAKAFDAEAAQLTFANRLSSIQRPNIAGAVIGGVGDIAGSVAGAANAGYFDSLKINSGPEVFKGVKPGATVSGSLF